MKSYTWIRITEAVSNVKYSIELFLEGIIWKF